MSMQISAVGGVTPVPSPASREARTATNSAVAVPFSERVGSKTFDGNVQRFDGEFVGAVDSLLGVNAAGPTLGTAEDRLETLVDFFA